MKEELKLAAVSLTATSDKARNLDNAFARVREAAAAGADWVQLPEMLAFMGPYDQLHDMAEPADGALVQSFSTMARELGIVLVAGTFGERPAIGEVREANRRGPGGALRVFNTCFVFGRDGKLAARYRKTHLFNLKGDGTRPAYCESDGYVPGDQLETVTLDGWRVGMSICYDLRFAELYYRLAAAAPLDMILAPSAFTKHTGEFHWELLLRSRAIEQQCYVYAANQVGEHAPGKASWGHSAIVDPWGRVLADSGDKPGIAYATVQKSAIAEVRAKLPVLENRRPEIYSGRVEHHAK